MCAQTGEQVSLSFNDKLKVVRDYNHLKFLFDKRNHHKEAHKQAFRVKLLVN